MSHLSRGNAHPRVRPFRGIPLLVAGLALFAWGCDAGPVEPVRPSDGAASLTTDAEAVLVGFTRMPGADERAQVESVGGTVTHAYRYIPVLAATIPAGADSVLAAQPGVAYVEPDLPLYPLGGMQITDWGVRKIEAPAAWAAGYRGDGVKVGIFDSGIDIDHGDLRVAGGIDLVGDGNGLDDCQGHGTHVAGIVAARDGGRYTVGVAPRAELYSMRLADCTWGGGTVSKMIQGLEWAMDNGIDVVNMSFGFGVEVVSLPTAGDLAADSAFDVAHAAGIVLIAASGNSSAPYVGYPAAHPKVIAVGATDDADMLATFSQYGTEQDVTAPGVNNLSSYLVGLGQETTLIVDSDDGRELEAVPLEFAGMTGRKGITASAVYAGLGTVVEFAGIDCVGRIAVVMRGGGSFAEKAQAAMDAGCAAAVIHNHTPGNFNGTLGAATTTDGRPWFPVVSISLEDGLYLKDRIEAGPTVTTLINDDGDLAIFSGTSMASPHAAGVAALILDKNPGLTPDEVRALLGSSADDLGTAGWDPLFGHGRINARRAVEITP